MLGDSLATLLLLLLLRRNVVGRRRRIVARASNDRCELALHVGSIVELEHLLLDVLQRRCVDRRLKTFVPLLATERDNNTRGSRLISYFF